MKQIISLFFLVLLANLLPAQTKVGKIGFAGGGLSGNIFSFNKPNLQDFIGFTLNLGFYTSPKSMLILDGSMTIHEGEHVGNFIYTIEYSNGKKEVKYDGSVTRNWRAIPVLLSWDYVFNVTSNFHIYTGPSLGFTSLSARNSFTPNVENAPSNQKKQKFALSYGVNVGLALDVEKRCVLGLSYKLLGNTTVNIDDARLQSPAHQINLTFAWRF